MKTLVCFSFMLMVIGIPLLNRSPVYADGFYTISSYKVLMNVTEANEIHVTETIDVDFKSDRHGIYRYIPLVYLYENTKEGHKEQKKKKISFSDIKVTNEKGREWTVQKYRQDNYLILKIGDPEYTLIGPQKYVLRYTCRLGQDIWAEKDYLYYNIIGTGWDASISNASFEINMPKEFDESQVRFTVGKKGSEDDSAVEYKTSGNAITGTVNRTLDGNEGLTVLVTLPEGYYINKPNPEHNSYYLIALASVLLAAIGLFLYFRFGKDKKPVITVEFYPPEGMNSAQVGYVIDGIVDNKDVVSLIIYWADKGYLKIINGANNEFSLKKLDFGDAPMTVYESMMFDQLFSESELVTSQDLRYRFHGTIEKVKHNIKASYELTKDKRIYSKSSNISQVFGFVIAALCTAVPLAKAAYSYFYGEFSMIAAFGIGIILTIATLLLFGHVIKKENVTGKMPVLLAYLPFLVYTVLTGCFLFFFTENPIVSTVCPAMAAISGFFAGFGRKRTDYGTELLGKLLGLKNFIRLAEKDRIKQLVEETPDYFFHILPYAYVLGVTDVWCKKFEFIAIQPPSWYQDDNNPNVFMTVLFMSTFHHNMDSYNHNMSIAPSSAGSSDSFGGFGGGGGGFSGGGFGGGGGGSW
ncbi:MAG: hypothetical protein BGN88_08600 [Clostridiales bacterium 43-6]|nr:MAG: hypothetical protein BGN88_08600 [Clostridiales bacterium 43-6]